MLVYACLVRDEEGGFPILAIAPSNEVLRASDLVVLEGEGSKARRMLSDAVLIDDQSEEFGLIEKATRLCRAIKIYGKYRFKELDWEEDKNNE